jgi:hypothetical protein
MLKKLFWVAFGIATLAGVVVVRKTYNDINNGAPSQPARTARAIAATGNPGVPAPPGGVEFMGIFFGADEKAILAKFGNQLKKVERQHFMGAYVDYIIPDYVWEGVHMEAYFQMDSRTHRLTSVLLRKMAYDQPLGIYDAEFNALMPPLALAYGEPAISSEGEPPVTFNDERTWLKGATLIELAYGKRVYSGGSSTQMLTLRFAPRS